MKLKDSNKLDEKNTSESKTKNEQMESESSDTNSISSYSSSNNTTSANDSLDTSRNHTNRSRKKVKKKSWKEKGNKTKGVNGISASPALKASKESIGVASSKMKKIPVPQTLERTNTNLEDHEDLVDCWDFESTSTTPINHSQNDNFRPYSNVDDNSSTNLIDSGILSYKMEYVGMDFTKATLENNEPCSSSSFKERLSSKSENPQTLKRESKSTLSEPEPDNKPSDKYVYSGVGRHFGKKKSMSFSTVTDCDNGGGGESGFQDQCSSKCYGWLMRLKAVTMVFFGTLFILSLGSLLFIFPIIVDPILFGIEAEFSREPVTCRTINFRAGVGASECAVPSCRAGCTAEVYQCIFIEVEYNRSVISSKPNSTNENGESDNFALHGESISGSSKDYNETFKSIYKNATLFININGCGFPPEVNCSEFRRKYGELGIEFSCHYSARNTSVVVPFYSAESERKQLFVSILLPITLSVFAAVSLFLTIKFCKSSGKVADVIIIEKTVSQLNLFEKRKNGKKPKIKNEQFNVEDIKRNGQVHEEGPSLNGKITNGHAFQGTVSVITGANSPIEIHNTIKNLHQRVSLESSKSNNSLQQMATRKPRFVKKNDVKIAPTTGNTTIQYQVISYENSNHSVQLFSPNPNNKTKLAEHKL